MADDLKNRPIIIKRKKVVGGDGHHGGAWKVAYADFVTAMMAFFMLMWLLNATTEQQRKGIADYFSPNVPIARISGGGEGAFGGESPFSELSVAQNGTGAKSSSGTGSFIASDFETFLRMLTTQIQNQDPLNPMESTDFATQLATFSGVEQQVRSNDLLSSLNAGIARLGLGDTARWVGMEAQANMAASFDGTPLELEVTPNDRAARMELVVMNSGGQVVQTQAIDPAGGRLTWTGETEAGAALPNGTYRFETRAYIEGEEVPKTEPVRVFARIHEARMEGDQLRLVMAGGVEIAADQVEALRMP